MPQAQQDGWFLPPIAEPLLRWYDANRRILPWRENPLPYYVWVSEIMLQQTRVEAVKPYFDRFIAALPDLPALADAPQEQLLKLWEGLGYYSRARNLQKAARLVMEQFGGRLPADFTALLSLPGIGRYTAGAIASIAYGLPTPAVDGNVLRVAARLLDSDADILQPNVKRAVEQAVERVLPSARPGDFNQAIMELGATVCGPGGAPKCLLCPLRELCAGFLSGRAEKLPVRAAKKPRRIQERTVFLLLYKGRIGLLRRPEKGLLAGLWELPSCEGFLSPGQVREQLVAWGLCGGSPSPLPAAKHIFSHVEWRMQGLLVPVTSAQDTPFTWASYDELRGRYPLPSAFAAYRQELQLLFEGEASHPDPDPT